MLEKLLFTIACLALPVVWGIIVNWLFVRWYRSRDTQSTPQPPDPNTLDFQI